MLTLADPCLFTAAILNLDRARRLFRLWWVLIDSISIRPLNWLVMWSTSAGLPTVVAPMFIPLVL